MLKLTYTETSFHLERLAQSLEEWIALRVILTIRVGGCICLESSTAAFLLSANLPELNLLASEVDEAITLCVADADYVEVTIPGIWIGGSQSAEGVFVTEMSYSAEFWLRKWQEAQINLSVLKK